MALDAIGKASTPEDSAVDFQHVFLFFLKEEEGICASKIYWYIDER